MKYLILLGLFLVMGHVNCQVPDSTTYTVTASDTLLQLTVKVYYSDDNDNVSYSSGTTALMDSSSFADYLLAADTRGRRIGGTIKIAGQDERAAAAQRFFQKEAELKDAGAISDLYEEITGNKINVVRKFFNSEFLGYWLIKPRGEAPIPVEIRLNNSGRLVVDDGSNTKVANTPSRDELEFRAIGTIPALNLFRVAEGRKRFRTLDGNYIMRPDRSR